ncbi:type ISP restriction/modification enzyme [Helicobacter muridarum]|uniref:site-specific DNA-methyltransferase (adenine-specific) n=2 Tax=Helicobacter muridarum TaxID=216 RepID=A0A377PXM6_9HELI|nr:type ISP restriction/modification enzyme [Helicobacter muridarum]STQ86353.1 adenine specific DNA methyltransferase [Helicobacter muridarum]
MQFLKDYLKAVQNISPQDKEHTYRTYLHNLLQSLKENLSTQDKALQSLHIKHEPNNDKEGRGAPDFLIQNQGLMIGYIENKRVNADLDSVAQSPQIEKYLRLSDNLMLTDYLRFCLVRKNDKGKAQIVQECRICDLSQLKATLKNKTFLESKEKELTELFKLFFAHSPKPIITAQEFASTLAQRTQILKNSLIEAQENTHITSLYETFKEQLYKELNFTEFADSLAQTLTYSLFLARLNNTSGKEIDLYNAKAFIPKSFPLIRAMSGFLDNLEDLDSIKWLIGEILYIINHIDIISIIKELNKASEKDLLGHYTTHFTHKDPYLHFYETFLSQYDPRLREIRGVYYTPASVVSFIINAIDSILKKDFTLQNGLGASLENDNITLLDFATGTGTFLLEAFRKALESIPKDSPRYNPKVLLSRFFGFEFLIAPYTIAHLKLSQSFKEEFNAPLHDRESLNIRLTNTLYFNKERDEKRKQSNLFAGMIELAQEFKEAQRIKENAILIITGNPPYSGASANKGLFEDNVRITYGLEPSEAHLNENEQKYIDLHLKNKTKESQKAFKAILERKKLKNEKNPKWLLDDYVKFICFAESKIKAQHSGIFAFISNNSFLDNPTFRGMRYHLLKTFDTIYILDLHGNARKKEAAPDGSKDENVFDIMQGVSINIFVKNSKKSLKGGACHSEPTGEESRDISHSLNMTNNLSTLYHYDLYGKRSDKTNFLYENTLDSIAWTTLEPKEPFYLFIPQNESLRAEYDKGWSVKDIFKVSSVGIVGGRDKFVMSDSDSLESLERFKKRIKRFMELDKESARQEFDLGKDSRDWKIEYAQKELRDTGNNSNNYVKIHYRPFDFRWTYYTGKSKGFHCMPRGEVMQHFLQGKNQALLVSRQSSAVGDDEINTIAITDKIVDINFYRRGGEQVMPLYLKNTESSKEKKSKKTKTCHDLRATARSISQDSDRDISLNAQYDKFEWVENFTPEFREFIDSKYNEHFSPEQILGYIYAVLFHKDYREKYIDFLKIDFPKIPFVESKEKFLALSALGQELILTHLMQDLQQEREREREQK